MRPFFVISVPESDFEPVLRTFHADSAEHAEEQFADAIPDERISWVLDSFDAPNLLPVEDIGISRESANALCKDFCRLQTKFMQKQDLVDFAAKLSAETYKFPGTETIAVTALLEDIYNYFGDEGDIKEYLSKNLGAEELKTALSLLEIE